MSHPLGGGGTLVASHTVAGPALWVVGAGRSFVAQPPGGVSRFDRARPRLGDSARSRKVLEDLPSGIPFQDAGDLTHGLALGEATSDVVAGGLVVSHPGDDEVIERRVGLPVPAPVQPMAGGLA